MSSSFDCFGNSANRLWYDRVTGTGLFQFECDGELCQQGFHYQLGDRAVRWALPLNPRLLDPARADANIRAEILGNEPILHVVVQAEGWAHVSREQAISAQSRRALRHILAEWHTHRLEGFESETEVGVELFVCERPEDPGAAAHPESRARRLGLNRPLYGDLFVVARRDEQPVAMDPLLAKAIAEAFDALTPAEGVLQAVRDLRRLRGEEKTSAHCIARAEKYLFDKARLYEVTLLGKAPPLRPR